MTYGCIASMKTTPGSRDEVVAILLGAAEGLRAAGCDAYVVGLADDDDVTIWVTEVWRSKEHHDASLELPQARAAIGKAMPLLTGEFTKQELAIAGGLGL
ncbi:quinol monooxygenase YgiN [Streptomyces puniciscabiei]|uniref:Quinol monooxygenase YgiN n=1 Tax=Streptomyces puniciscabiei TaxID=164348 RepID=A0A542UGM5_9ACTN|nr:antibiotic biosynthesis monooxygenase [Streptomyces puniciscabiei]TQK98240.1 quinol monooxygenase YgiN [Streptomyces puniciscabiei]